MLESWQKDRSNRPTFTQIVKTLDKLAKCPENLMKLAQQMTRYLCQLYERNVKIHLFFLF